MKITLLFATIFRNNSLARIKTPFLNLWSFFQFVVSSHKELRKFKVKSKEGKFPNEKSSPAFDCFDWLRSWIEAADWSMVPRFKVFAGFLN